MGLALLVDAGFNVRCLDRVQTAPLQQATANEAQSWQKLGALGAHQGNVSKCEKQCKYQLQHTFCLRKMSIKNAYKKHL